MLDRAGWAPKWGRSCCNCPRTFALDPARLVSTLKAFPRQARVAFEPRHESWYTDEVMDILRQYRVAFCLSDTPQRKSPLWRTADWGYVRLHEGRANPAPCYGRTALTNWAGRLADLWDQSEDVYVYFNNDHGGCAVRDAHRFALAADRAGLLSTRVPTSREASLTREHTQPLP